MRSSPLTSPALAASTRTSLLRTVFSFPVAACSLLVVLATCTVRGRFDDPDMWWHLKLGQLIWTSHRIPRTDIFSWTTNHHATVPHEWLSQLLIFAPYRLNGSSGLMLWLCVASASILIAGYALCSLYSGNAKVAFLGALAICLFGTSGFAIRPQVVGYFLLIVELLLLHLGRVGNPRWFFALPPLFALWVNCHGSFFFGLIVASIVLFSSLCNFRIGSLEARRWESPRSLFLAISLLFSLFAIFLNPGGIKVVEYPLDMLFGQDAASGNISEWMPLDLSSPRGLALIAVVGVIVLAVVAHLSQLFFHELHFMAFGIWLAVSHRRLIFPCGILLAPILTRVLAHSWENYDRKKDRPALNALFIAGALLVAFLAFPSRQDLALQVERNSPVNAVTFLESHHPEGPMLNAFADGGYLIWAAPDYPVFIDGRADVFAWTGVLQQYGEWATLRSDPRALLNKFGVALILLPRDAPMAHVLPLMREWKLAYSDSAYAIFTRAS